MVKKKEVKKKNNYFYRIIKPSWIKIFITILIFIILLFCFYNSRPLIPTCPSVKTDVCWNPYQNLYPVIILTILGYIIIGLIEEKLRRKS